MRKKLLVLSITFLLAISFTSTFPSVGAVENTPPRFKTEWERVAVHLGEYHIYSLAVYNDSLFGSTGNSGKLYKWNDVDSWIEVAGQLGSEEMIQSLVVYDDSLYGSTAWGGRLYKWNDVDSWIEIAGLLGEEQSICSLTVYNDSLYGGTYPNSKLYKWNDVDSWIEVAGQLGSEYGIYSLIVYNDGLYGGTGYGGRLYKWNDVDSWIEVAGQLGSEEMIYSLAVYDGSLYGSTGYGGRLYKWNDVDSWIEVAGQYGGEEIICSLAVYDNSLYGGTGSGLTHYDGKLYKWNDVDSWIEVADMLFSQEEILSLIVYNNDLFGGTGVDGYLFKLSQLISPLHDSLNIPITTTLKIHVIDRDCDTMIVSFYWDDDTLIEMLTNIDTDTIAETSSLSLDYETTYNWYAIANDSYSQTQSNTFTFTTIPMPNFPPDKPTCISPTDNQENVSIDTTLKVHVIDRNNDTMNISFHFIEGIPSYIFYTGENIIDYNYYLPSAIRLSPTELVGYDGEYLTGVMIHDAGYVTDGYTIEIYADGNESNPRVLTTSQNISYQDGSGWNEIMLDNPILINDTHHIWIVLTGNFIVGLDDGCTSSGKSDLIYYNNAWVKLFDDFGYDTDFMIKARIGGLFSHITTIPDVMSNSDVETSNLSLDYNTLYNWCAIAYDSLLDNTSNTFSFTTIQESYPPDKPTCVSPTDEEENVSINTKLKVHVIDMNDDSMTVSFYWSNDTLIETITDVQNDTDAETSSLLLDYLTQYDWYATANDSVFETRSDGYFTFSTSENAMPVFKHTIPRLESDGYLYMIYRNGNINLSNLNLLMGSYSPFTVCKFNYTSSDWDCEVITINSNDYIRVKINESDMPYTDTLIPVSPQIRFKISDVEDDKLDIIVTSNSSGEWEVIEQWSDVSQGWFICENSNIDEYNTTYYYSIDVTDSYSNNLVSDFNFVTTSTEPTIPPITPSIDIIYIIGIILLIGIGGSGVYILSPKKRKRIRFK